jgi:broad specificity phosphatase PhoE
MPVVRLLTCLSDSKVIYGGADIPLSARGEEEAKLAAAYLSDREKIGVHSLLSS